MLTIDSFLCRAEDSPEPLSSPLRPRMAGGSNRGGDGQQQQQGSSRGGDLQQGQGGRVDFAPASVRDLEVNTSARAQADKSTLKVCMHAGLSRYQ